MNRVIMSLALALALLFASGRAFAQKEQPDGPVYIVQEGDTLWEIAQRFGLSVGDLQQMNDLADPGQLVIGGQLVIPGLEGIRGVLVTETVPVGETLRSLSRRYGIPTDALVRLNHLSSPAELYSGANLIVPEDSAARPPAGRAALAPGQSLLELAAIQGANPWSLVRTNGLGGTWEALPGDVLRNVKAGAADGPGALPGAIESLEVEPQPFTQGGTVLIRLESADDLEIGGSLVGHELRFFQDQDGSLVALQGIHAMTTPGLYPLTLSGQLQDGTPFGFSQMVSVLPGDFNYETLAVDPETVDPANTKPEDELWNGLTQEATPQRLWEDVFLFPVSRLSADCYPSFYGSRRSYNGSPFNYFHTGLDFCYSSIEPQIYAPASGVVVFTGELTVRGNATMIDHGWGMYTGYMHQSEILVEAGDRVEAGQVIGMMGRTGRVTGAHLHLEVWVGGVQVDPMEWLEREFP
jgi:murein DD-endopeptidase MepM/ murein hydrolase activator NlpD